MIALVRCEARQPTFTVPGFHRIEVQEKLMRLVWDSLSLTEVGYCCVCGFARFKASSVVKDFGGQLVGGYRVRLAPSLYRVHYALHAIHTGIPSQLNRLKEYSYRNSALLARIWKSYIYTAFYPIIVGRHEYQEPSS